MKYIEVTENRAKVRILLRDIVYAEVFSKTCLIHTSSGTVNTYLTMSKLIEMVDSVDFLRCHHSYVVNLNRVKALRGDEFILDNGNHALISRRMKPTVQKAYNDFIVKPTEQAAETDGSDALFTKEIRIFIASPLSDLENDINELGLFISNLNSRYSRGGVYFSLYVGGEGELQEDMEVAKNSDLFYIIYHDKPGKHALAELETARRAYQKSGAPKIIVYCKQPDITQMGDLYSSQYAHIDTVKLSIVLQLKSFGIDHAKLDIDGTSLVLEGRALMTLDNIPVIFNSKSFSAMKSEYAELEKDYWELRDKVRKNPDDDNALTAYLSTNERKDKVSESMHGLQMDIIAMETSFLEKAGTGYISPRLMQARLLFEDGDLEGARKLLDFEEMLREDERDEVLREETQKKIMAKVSEYMYLADMLKTDVNDPERFVTIERIYEQAVALEEKYNLSERVAVWKYVDHLYHHKEFVKAADFARRQLNILEADQIKEAEIASLSNFISRCYNRLHRYGDAEEMSRKALEIRERLSGENPEVYEPDLAKSLDGLARLLEITGGRHKQAESLRKRALDIYERLSAENPAFLPDLAKCYNNMSEMYVEIQHFSEGEEFCLKALGINERLAAENPAAYESHLARSYNELAFLYTLTHRYNDSESLYFKAIAIYERLAAENPEAYESDLAYSLILQARVYDRTRNYADGEMNLTKALAITERLVAKHPAAYEYMLQSNLSNLAKIYEDSAVYTKAEPLYRRALDISKRPSSGTPTPSHTGIISYNLASLLEKIGRFDESEALHKSSLEIFENLAIDNAATYDPELAKGYNGLAILYKSSGHDDKAETFFKKAINIRERLAAENPEAFEPVLAKSCHDFAGLCFATGKYSEAEALYLRALDIRKKLTAETPAVFGADLAQSYAELAGLYEETGRDEQAKECRDRAQSTMTG